MRGPDLESLRNVHLLTLCEIYAVFAAAGDVTHFGHRHRIREFGRPTESFLRAPRFTNGRGCSSDYRRARLIGSHAVPATSASTWKQVGHSMISTEVLIPRLHNASHRIRDEAFCGKEGAADTPNANAVINAAPFPPLWIQLATECSTLDRITGLRTWFLSCWFFLRLTLRLGLR